MKLSEQRTRLRWYIYSQSYRNILTAIATKELSSIYKISKNEAPLTESDISNYIRDNFDHLNSETNKAIEQLVKEILPDDDFKTKAKKAFQIFFDLDVLAILLPVLYVCVRYSIIEYKESNTITECSDGIVASIFVLLLLSFSTYYYFKNK